MYGSLFQNNLNKIKKIKDLPEEENNTDEVFWAGSQ